MTNSTISRNKKEKRTGRKQEGHTRAIWNEYPFLMPEHVAAKVKNSAKGDGLYYAGIWQELVVLESDGLIDWVKSILR